jgi:branched-chain amino acid transport system substrate-binding protein
MLHRLLLLITPALLVLAPASPAARATSHKTVTIVVEAPFHAWLPDTASFLTAARMAIADRVARSGPVCGDWTVKVEPRDHGSPVHFVNWSRLGGNARSDVADPKIGAVLGPYTSGAAMTMLPILSGGRLLTVSPSNTSPCLTLASCQPEWLYAGPRNYARLAAHDAVQGRQQAHFAADIVAAHADEDAQDGRPRAYAVHLDDAYGDILTGAFQDEAAAAGVTIVGSESYGYDEMSFAGIAANVVASGANVVVHAGFGEAIDLTRALRLGGYHGPILTADAAFGDWLLAELEDHAGALYVTSPGMLPEADPVTESWAGRYLEFSGQEVAFYTAEAYLATELILDGFEGACRAGATPLDRDAVRAAALAPGSHTSGLSDFTIDARGDLVGGPINLFHADGGSFLYHSTRR